MPCPLCGADEQRPLLRNSKMSVLRCACGMAFAAPDTPDEPYDEAYFSSRSYGREAVAEMKKRSFREVLRCARRALNGAPAASVIDIGCGYGWSLDAAKEDGLAASGAEASASGRAEASKRHDVRASSAGFPAESFDVVTMIDVIEHVRDPIALLKEGRRLLKPGGALVLTTPDLSSLSARLMRGWWPYVIPEHLVYFDRATMGRALRAAGLEPAETSAFKKSLRADYVASMLAARRDALGALGARVFGLFGGAEIGVFSGDMIASARKPHGASL